MGFLERNQPFIVLLAGLIGACGVALAALATHTGASLLGPASTMCLVHAPAIFALLACAEKLGTARLSAIVLAIGTVVFAGDLSLKQFYGVSLFPMAAPLGGLTMIGGWLIAAAGGLFRSGRS